LERPERPTRIDALLLADYPFLTAHDECYCLREYRPRVGYSYSATNNFISNLKKQAVRHGRPDWHYKEEAVEEAARLLLAGFDAKWLRATTLVPIPPSVVKGEEGHDDRMVRVLHRLAALAREPLDIRELIRQSRTTRSSSRSGGARLTFAELRAVWGIEEALAEPSPRRLCVFDDLLTTGLHFKVAKELLAGRFAPAGVVGIFLARSLH
jgi:predicted amidophosphoribosyltransferase